MEQPLLGQIVSLVLGLIVGGMGGAGLTWLAVVLRDIRR